MRLKCTQIRELQWKLLDLKKIKKVIKNRVPLFTLGSVCSTNASGAEQIPETNYCVRGTRTQPLICVGCSVHYSFSCAINKGGFFEIAFVVFVDTHLPRFEALAYVFSVLPPFDELSHWVILASSAFIIQEFAEVFYSVFVKRSSFKSLLNLRKGYIFH